MAVRETEEFAAYLRGLKERSGHSYGTLARKLHTSTSTLHRYCSGASVPARYAPVERLARLCGAGPEELLELHRRWLRADAVRGRAEPERPAPGRGAASEPVPEPASEPASEPGRVDGAAGAGTLPGSRERAAPSGPPAPGAAPGRRFLWPAAAVLALVLALSVAAAVRFDAGRLGRERPTASGAPPSAVPSSASSAPPRAAGGPGKAPRGGAPAAPLEWTARSHVWRHGCDHRYLSDLPPSRIPPPPVEQDASAWAGSLGAVHGGETIVEATVRAAGPAPVVVEAAHVRVTARRTPPAWSSYEMSNGCGGSLTPAAFSVDLDAPRPLVRPVAGYDGEGGRELPAVRLPYRVTAGDPLALRVEARTEGCDCDWHVELEWSSGGDSGTLRVDDGGRPFRTSAVEGRPAYGWSLEEGAWTGG